MIFLFFSGRVDWWWIFRKIFLAFMVSTKDSASCPGQLATSQDITGRSSETGPISWYNEDEWRDENFQGWNCFHMTCSEQQNITFNDLSFREIPQIRGWQEMKRSQDHRVGMYWLQMTKCWLREISLSYLGCFVFISPKMVSMERWSTSIAEDSYSKVTAKL